MSVGSGEGVLLDLLDIELIYRKLVGKSPLRVRPGARMGLVYKLAKFAASSHAQPITSHAGDAWASGRKIQGRKIQGQKKSRERLATFCT